MPPNAPVPDLGNLTTQCGYELRRGDEVVHEYEIPGDYEIHNCGGYLDKLLKWRDPALLDHLRRHGVSAESFRSPRFPILGSRSPQLDLALLPYIERLRKAAGAPVGLFDHGCTVAEHWDLLDVMLQASSGARAVDALRYCGLDNSALSLAAARLFHLDVPEEQFQLILAEGTDLDVGDEFELSMSIGVVNHVRDPLSTLEQLLGMTTVACALAIWVTSEDVGSWTVRHNSQPAYFFSVPDLMGLEASRPGGRFYVLDYFPEEQATQPKSFVGLDDAGIAAVGSYHLLWTTDGSPSTDVAPLLP